MHNNNPFESSYRVGHVLGNNDSSIVYFGVRKLDGRHVIIEQTVKTQKDAEEKRIPYQQNGTALIDQFQLKDSVINILDIAEHSTVEDTRCQEMKVMPSQAAGSSARGRSKERNPLNLSRAENGKVVKIRTNCIAKRLKQKKFTTCCEIQQCEEIMKPNEDVELEESLLFNRSEDVEHEYPLPQNILTLLNLTMHHLQKLEPGGIQMQEPKPAPHYPLAQALADISCGIQNLKMEIETQHWISKMISQLEMKISVIIKHAALSKKKFSCLEEELYEDHDMVECLYSLFANKTRKKVSQCLTVLKNYLLKMLLKSLYDLLRISNSLSSDHLCILIKRKLSMDIEKNPGPIHERCFTAAQRFCKHSNMRNLEYLKTYVSDSLRTQDDIPKTFLSDEKVMIWLEVLDVIDENNFKEQELSENIKHLQKNWENSLKEKERTEQAEHDHCKCATHGTSCPSINGTSQKGTGKSSSVDYDAVVSNSAPSPTSLTLANVDTIKNETIEIFNNDGISEGFFSYGRITGDKRGKFVCQTKCNISKNKQLLKNHGISRESLINHACKHHLIKLDLQKKTAVSGEAIKCLICPQHFTKSQALMSHMAKFHQDTHRNSPSLQPTQTQQMFHTNENQSNCADISVPKDVTTIGDKIGACTSPPFQQFILVHANPANDLSMNKYPGLQTNLDDFFSDFDFSSQ